MQFRTEPRKLPVVFSVEVSDIPDGGARARLKYRAALSISWRRAPGPPRSAISRSATSTATGC